MKKALFFLFLSSIYISCSSPSVTKEKEPKQQEKRIKTFIDNFISANPNYLNNEITKKEAAQQLANEFTTFAKHDTLAYIADLPTQYYAMAAYEGDTLYVVKFYYPGLSNNDCVSKEYTLSYRVISILPKKEAIKLIDNQKYYLSGSFVSFLNMRTFLDVILASGNPTLAIYDFCGENPNDLPTVNNLSGKPDFNLGTLVIENLKFVPAK